MATKTETQSSDQTDPPTEQVVTVESGRYIAIEPLLHNGAPYAPDDPVALSPKQAKPLLDAGVVRLAD